jgi:hypothetical protein
MVQQLLSMYGGVSFWITWANCSFAVVVDRHCFHWVVVPASGLHQPPLPILHGSHSLGLSRG